MTILNAQCFRRLRGQTREIGDTSYHFEDSAHRADVVSGGEGYVVTVRHGKTGEQLVLKVYRLPSLERETRMRFLSRLSLHELLPAFAAVPRTVVKDVVALPLGDGGALQDVLLEGVLATRINGDGLATLYLDGWDPPLDTRVALAVDLCNAVRVLSHVSIAHGDLSANNVLIEGAREDRPQVRLIDFDGFHHPSVPLIPMTKETGGRGWGTDGYRSAVHRVGDPNAIVCTDRVSLAALVFELVVLRPGDLLALGRESLVSQDEVDAQAAEGKRIELALPNDIVQRWPAGYTLLRRAFAVLHPEIEAPSDIEWQRALLELVQIAPIQRRHIEALRVPMPHFATEPLLRPLYLCVRRTNSDSKGRYRRIVQRRGSMAPVQECFSWMAYERTSTGLLLYGYTEAVVFFQPKEGRWEKLQGKISISFNPGDMLRYLGFDLDLRTSEPR